MLTSIIVQLVSETASSFRWPRLRKGPTRGNYGRFLVFDRALKVRKLMSWAVQGVLVTMTLSIIFLASSQEHAAAENRGEGHQPLYISSAQCSACHTDVAAEWQGSDHGWAWREPTSANVLGNFDDTTFENKGVSSRFYTRNGKYFVETDGPDGKPTEFEIKYTVGVKPLQQYLVETGNGRLQVLDLAWDTEQNRWYHLYPSQNNKAGDGLHWTGPYKNWNARCAECHATSFEKNYDPTTKSYSSKQAEIGVGCEACHGPGEAHASWAEARERFDPSVWSKVSPNGLTVQFKAGDTETEIQQCAGCHSRREPFSASSPTPGTKFADNYRLALLRNGLYHADGQILDEVYVYGSFLQSKMYASGVSCTNCHQPHSNQLKADGNAVCTQCHSPQGNPGFPSLKPAFYDGPEHHFHETGSEGAQCASCHMPERLYMVIDGRRDHSFRVPRPDLSVKNGTPNTCTDCHTDQTAAWAVEQVSQRHPNGRTGSPHYGEIFSAARSGINAELEGRLLALLEDLTVAPIVRATAMDLLKTAPSKVSADTGEPFLGDEDPLVRGAAIALQRGAPLAARVQRIVPLLDDPSQSVRIEAARALIDVTGVRYPPQIANLLRSATNEYRASHSAKTDFPEVQLAIGGTALAQRDLDAAERAFSEAVTMDPQLSDGWLTLARVQIARREISAAEKTLERAVQAVPDDAVLYQSLAGVKFMAGKYQEAVFPLERALHLIPGKTAIMADLGILRSRLGDHVPAILLLNRAKLAGNQSPELLYALVESYVATRNRGAAERTVQELERLHPAHPSVTQARRLFGR
jgi:predicted CXXCH cytochrome family protein